MSDTNSGRIGGSKQKHQMTYPYMYGLRTAHAPHMPVFALGDGVDFPINPNARTDGRRQTTICRSWAKRNRHMWVDYQPLLLRTPMVGFRSRTLCRKPPHTPVSQCCTSRCMGYCVGLILAGHSSTQSDAQPTARNRGQRLGLMAHMGVDGSVLLRKPNKEFRSIWG